MNSFSSLRVISIWFLVSSAMPGFSVAQEKPRLSVAIREAIDTKGLEYAKQYFAEQYQSRKDRYDIDMDGINALGGAYAQAGNVEATAAVMEIATPFIRDLMAEKMAEQPGYGDLQESVEQQRREEAEQSGDAKPRKPQGPDRDDARTDLERFTGLYGESTGTDKNRQLWVMASCDGYLVIGAMWGDASPWWMKSSGDRVFTHSSSFATMRMEFDTDGSDTIVKMNHDLDFMNTPLRREGPLPDDWEPCLDRPIR